MAEDRISNIEALDWFGAIVCWGREIRLGPVLQQNLFDICWSIAASDATSALYRIYGRELQLSAQQLVDGVGPCPAVEDGSLSHNLHTPFEYKRKYGLMSDANYPFVGGRQPCRTYDERCQENDWWRIDGWESLPESGNINVHEEHLLVLLHKHPVVGVIEVDNSFENIRTTIYPGPGKHVPSSDKTLHAVLFVGYGNDFFVIKNSQGSEWGVDGYGMIARAGYQQRTKRFISHVTYPLFSGGMRRFPIIPEEGNRQ